MTASYLLPDNDIPIRGIDKVRLLIGEIDINNTNIQDEEIQFFIDEEANVYMAASMAALAIARKLQAGGLEDLKVGETRLRTKNVGQLEALANRLRERGSAYKLVSAGGVYVADRTAYDANSALIKSSLTRDMHDFPAVEPRNKTETT
jgi:hypothetical protein